MLRFDYQRHTLRFTFVAGTSRGVLTEKDTYFLRVYDDQSPDMQGWGECSTLPGLSIDHVPNYEAVLGDFCEISNKTAFGAQSIKEAFEAIPELIPNAYPSIVFGFETALLDLANGGRRVLFDTPFARGEAGIAINGLVWMGEPAFMKKQIDEKLAQGYTTLKLKIGAIDFAQECALLAYIREHFPPERITLRVDANGAFRPDEAMRKLEKLAAFGLHSIEQPIAAGQWVASRELCARSPVPVALDEELTAVRHPETVAAGRFCALPRVDRTGRNAAHRLVDDLGVGIERGAECHCAVHGLARQPAAAGLGNGAIVPQQRAVAFGNPQRIFALQSDEKLGLGS